MDFNFSALGGTKPSASTGPFAWRDGKLLAVDPRQYVLPQRCLLTGVAEDLEEVDASIRYMPVGSPWQRLAFYCSTGRLGAVLLENQLGESLDLQGVVAASIADRRRRTAFIGKLILGIGVLLLLAGVYFGFIGENALAKNNTLLFVLFLGGVAAVLAGLVVLFLGTGSLLSYVENRGDLVMLSGASPGFLATLPDLATRPRDLTLPVNPRKRSSNYAGFAHLAAILGFAVFFASVALFTAALQLTPGLADTMRAAAFWGGLVAVHISALMGAACAVLSQQTAEWRLGRAAGTPLFFLLLVCVAQDWRIIHTANQAAQQEAERIKNQTSPERQKRAAMTAPSAPVPRPVSPVEFKERFKPREIRRPHEIRPEDLQLEPR